MVVAREGSHHNFFVQLNDLQGDIIDILFRIRLNKALGGFFNTIFLAHSEIIS